MSKREVSVKSLSNKYETGHTDEISIDAIKRSGPGSKGRLTLQKKKVESYTVGASVSALIILGGPRFQQQEKRKRQDTTTKSLILAQDER